MIDVEGRTGSDTLTERLLLAGATFLFILLPVAVFLAPVPLAVLHARHGPYYGIATAVAVSLVTALLALSPLTFAQVLLLLGPGVALGEGIRDGLSSKAILGATTVALVAAMAVFVFMEQRTRGINPFDEAHRAVEAMFQRMAARDAAASPEAVEELRRLFREDLAMMQRMVPAGLFLSSLGVAAIDMSLTRRLLEKLPGEERAARLRLPPFGEWRFSVGVGTGLLLGWLLPRWFPLGETLASALLNVTVVCAVLVAVQGASVLWHTLGRIGTGVGWRVAVALVAAVALLAVPGLPLVLPVVGLIDMVFDVRRLGREA